MTGPGPAPPEPARPVPPVVIGLVGGIAAGKSAVAAAFSSRGLGIVDADRVARDVVATREIATALREAFGDGVFADDGSLDRAAMARVVFADPAARRRLEAITHPAIRSRILAELRAQLAAGKSAILDAPLLLEGGLVDYCHWVVFVHADEAQRARRAAGRGWEPGELERREQAQLPLEVKSRRADATIDTSGTLDETDRQVAAFLLRCASTPPPASPLPLQPRPHEADTPDDAPNGDAAGPPAPPRA